MFFIFPYIGNNNPNRLSCFSEGVKPPTRKMLEAKLGKLPASHGDSGGASAEVHPARGLPPGRPRGDQRWFRHRWTNAWRKKRMYIHT